VKRELAEHGNALVVDCHSFPSRSLPCDRNQSVPRPDFCIGTDSFHTPQALADLTALSLRKMGYTVQVDRPYGGALVPMESYRRDRRVASIMIEINRRLYMDEMTDRKIGEFDPFNKQIESVLLLLRESQR